MSKSQPEYDLQVLVAQYLNWKKIRFLSDVRAQLKLTIPQQVRSKKIQSPGFACPDILIFMPGGRLIFRELKAESPYRKDGCLKTDAHLARQMDTIEELRELGYDADFAWTLEQIQEAVERVTLVKS